MEAYLFWALIALQILDLATTAYALKRNLADEGNTLVAQLMRKYGRDRVLIGGKVVAIAIIAVTFEHWPDIMQYLAVAFYVAIVGNNVAIIVRKKGKM